MTSVFDKALYACFVSLVEKEKGNSMHKKILEKAAKSLKKDAKHYAKEAAHTKGIKKKHELIEKREASSAAKDLKKRARKAHEY